jgi:AraC-like DNA-binding protein
MSNLSEIPPDAISVAFLEAGYSNEFADGYIHCKRAPSTIIAQPVEGRYEVISEGRCAVAQEGEAFLAREDQPLEIVHHARRRGALMKARWLHVRFLIFTSIDFVSLLALPGKLERRHGVPFGRIIVELLTIQARKSEMALPPLARRNELGFAALRLLCESCELSDSGVAFLSQADRLTPVLSFVRENLAQPLAIDDLAEVAHLSRSRFHSYFREHMRLSPMDYVKRVRLSEARQRLLTTAEPVYAIAEATGFANPYHFSREFKTNSGLSPREFRKQNGGLQV